MVFQNISKEHKEKLLDYIVDWNCNGKYCLAAQVINKNIINLSKLKTNIYYIIPNIYFSSF